MKQILSRFKKHPYVGALVTALALPFVGSASSAGAAEPIKLGHVAALSGGSAQSGESITRGLTIAIEEINAAGGLLGGRPIELVQRDDESKPPRGLIAARELIFKEKVAAFFGGLDTAGIPRDRAPCQQRESALYGGLGGGHPDYS